MEEKAERRSALSFASAVLGVQTAARHSTIDWSLATRQGPKDGIQGKARICDLSRQGSPRRP